MTVEAPQPNQVAPPPAPFDTDRMTDLLDAQVDDYSMDLDQAQKDGLRDQVAEAGFDRVGSFKSVVQRYSAESKTPDEYLQSLREVADRQTAELHQRPNDRRAAELKAILGVVKFIENDIANPEFNNARVESYRKKQSEQAKDNLEKLKDEDQRSSEQKVEEVRQEAGIDKEQEHTRLIAEVVKACGANFFTAWPRSVTPGRNGGFVEKPDDKFLKPNGFNGVTPGMNFLTGADNWQTKYPENRYGKIDQVMGNKGITEVVYLEPVEENITEPRTTYLEQKQGGVLGLGARTIKVPKTEQIVTGTRAVATADLVKGGDTTSCYRLSYTTSSLDNDRKYQYQAQDGRFGQSFNAEILLPEPLARKVAVAIKEDPNFLHKLIDELAIQDLKISPEMWRDGTEETSGHPLRPPYEKWREADGGRSKLYMVEKDQIRDEIAQGTVDFDPKFVIEY